ncbi:MAG TPA: hypothetical protein VE641_15000 [Chthoniobacterales bacterium]|nr:hypothetical protein [Chthoniobacterales bacterium]
MTTANSTLNSCIAHWRILLLVSFTFPGLLHAQTRFHSFTVQVHGAGKPVIFIPGLACPGSVWDTTVAQISGAYECHVITIIDLPPDLVRNRWTERLFGPQPSKEALCLALAAAILPYTSARTFLSVT